MPRLVNKIKKNKFTLLAELFENEAALASAAEKAGADAVQIILNRPIKEELNKLKDIIKSINIPLGVQMNKDINIEESDFNAGLKAGIDFVSIGVQHLSSAQLSDAKVSRILALDSRFNFDEVIELSKSNFDVIDAAIIPVSLKGKDLGVGDLQNYISIIISTGLPVLIPTQCKIRPSEIPIIIDAGAKGMILTPTVYGRNQANMIKTINQFKFAVEEAICTE